MSLELWRVRVTLGMSRLGDAKAQQCQRDLLEPDGLVNQLLDEHECVLFKVKALVSEFERNADDLDHTAGQAHPGEHEADQLDALAALYRAHATKIRATLT